MSFLTLVATVPFAPAAYLLIQRIILGFSESNRDDIGSILSSKTWRDYTLQKNDNQPNTHLSHATITSQLIAYLFLAVLGHFATHSLIPKIKV